MRKYKLTRKGWERLVEIFQIANTPHDTTTQHDLYAAGERCSLDAIREEELNPMKFKDWQDSTNYLYRPPVEKGLGGK